jgi:hypothetical protein
MKLDRARVYWNGCTPGGVRDSIAFESNLQPLDAVRFGHANGQTSQALLECGSASERNAFAFFLRPEPRKRCGFFEGRPGARSSAELFVAVGEVQQGTDAGVQALAGLEFGARLRVALLLHEPATFLEQSFGCGLREAGLRE